MREAALVLIKPDALVKSLTGNILSRISSLELEIIGAKVVKVSKELAEKHYEHLKDKPFFEDVINYICGRQHGRNKVFALVYAGEDAIDRLRELAGSTNPEEASPVSIRGAYGRITTKGVYENVLHVSDSQETAEREIKMWFSPEELIEDLYPTKTTFLGGRSQQIWA